MPTDPPPGPRPLVAKPLVEAIFELRWELEGDNIDRGFQLLPGRYHDRVKELFPAHRPLEIAQIPEALVPFHVRHQFRATPNGWPVTQVGPGILTVNETSGYSWERFKPLVITSVKKLAESYPSELPPLTKASLSYKNAIDVLAGDPNPMEFLRSMLHTEIVLDTMLFEEPGKPGEAQALQLAFALPLRKPRATGRIHMASGTRDTQPVVVLDIDISADGAEAPPSIAGLPDWLDQAHRVAEAWFFSMTRGKLQVRFDGGVA